MWAVDPADEDGDGRAIDRTLEPGDEADGAPDGNLPPATGATGVCVPPTEGKAGLLDGVAVIGAAGSANLFGSAVFATTLFAGSDCEAGGRVDRKSRAMTTATRARTSALRENLLFLMRREEG